jgi:lipopolysaccharide biosynthesis regulator YciM
LSCCRRCLQIERELARDAADATAPSRLAAAYGDLAYVELFGDDPKATIAHATRALQLDRDQPRIALTLAHAYLFDNQYGTARTCYRMMLKHDAVDGGRSVAEMIREDFQQLRKYGRTHPDMAKIEKLPAQTPLPAVPSASPKV